MKIFNFSTYDEFLERFDGRIYSIDDVYGKYLCDLEEEDLLKFVLENKILGHDGCDWFLKSNDYKQEILSEAIYINIRDEKTRTN